MVNSGRGRSGGRRARAPAAVAAAAFFPLRSRLTRRGAGPRRAGVDAIHPGYGFLSENEEFAQACADNGITFVGPKIENLNTFADKTSARRAIQNSQL